MLKTGSYVIDQKNGTMRQEDKRVLLHVARQIVEYKYLRVEKIRQFAGSEEIYLILIRELDRVKGQIQRARSMNAPATLTLTDWFGILERFDWRCAYCHEKPFEVMMHIVPLPAGGTSAENCVPACYSCRARKNSSM